MASDKRNYIIEENLSYAWGKALSLLLESGISEVQPLFVTVKNIADNTPNEDHKIRESLDQLLLERERFDCHTVANTIFPKSLWNPQKNRGILFSRYEKIFPQLLKLDRIGKYGRYFDRMIRYGEDNVNQLDFIIRTKTEKNNNRRSALQVCIFDPNIDHHDQPMRGFPCLQQVSFAPLLGGRLSVTGYYPYQYIFDRAYGNYLGLCWLGHFVAHEMGLKFAEMNCIAGIAKLGGVGKTDKDIQNIHGILKQIISL